MSTAELETPAAPAVGPRQIDDTGIVVHPISLDGSIFGWAAGVDDTVAVLDRFRDEGGTLVTTADHYAGGRSEVMIGSWLRSGVDRSEVVVATKIGRHPDAPGLSGRNILRATEASLERLGTDYVDFLAFDGDHPGTPIDESLEAADRLVREGKVRFLAASAMPPARVKEFLHVASEGGYPRFHALFAEYSLMERTSYERDLAPIAGALGRAGLARLPLASGYLTGQFRTRDDVPHSVMFGGAMRHIGRRGSRVLDVLESIAREIGETPARVALSWVLLKPGIASAVVRVKDVGQLAQFMAAADVALTRTHVTQLDRASAT